MFVIGHAAVFGMKRSTACWCSISVSLEYKHGCEALRNAVIDNTSVVVVLLATGFESQPHQRNKLLQGLMGVRV